MRRWMPTNIVLDLIRTREGLKFGVPAMLLAIPYLLAAHGSTFDICHAKRNVDTWHFIRRRSKVTSLIIKE